MPLTDTTAEKRQPGLFEDLVLSAGLTAAQMRKLQREVKAGKLVKLRQGIYAGAHLAPDELRLLVRQHWQKLVGTVVPGGVVSYISAMTSGIQEDGTLTVSHPAIYGKKVELPGLTIVEVRGPGPLPYDMPLQGTGLHWAGRTRCLLENVGQSAPRRARREKVEEYLVAVMNSGGEKALNDIRDQAASLSGPLGMEKEEQLLRAIIGALLGSHARGELRTRDGQLVAQGTPADAGRLALFEVLAAYLRTCPLPRIEERVPNGVARHHCALIESYFSNYVEGTKFSIEEACDIVLNNRPVTTRPKDSHDVLGVFRLAVTAPYRNNPPVCGEDFLEGLQAWHADMLKMRPEANPGQLKLDANYAGNTKFVEPMLVRGTMKEGSRLALSVPEGLARAIYYAFLISEIHPFDDGNGRLSRLVMNAELSRVGLHRVIIPTLFHPQYVDCARHLTRNQEPTGFVRSIAKMARWCAQFDYTDLTSLIAQLKASNAFEESPMQYKLQNLDGSVALPD